MFRRINVVGTSGSGKTTLSRELAEALRIPHLEMDALYWGPNWTCPSEEQFSVELADALRGDAWVLDGNYTCTTAVKWSRVECVIWIDLPFWQTIGRVLTRSIRRTLTQQELWEGTGNRESIRKSFFSRDSIVLWAVQTYWKNKQQFAAASSDPAFGHIKFLRLTRSRAARELVEEFERLGANGKARLCRNTPGFRSSEP